MLLWITAPIGVSFFLRVFSGEGWKSLGIRPGLRKNAAWYAVSILVYPACITLVLSVGSLFDVVSLFGFSMNVFVVAVSLALIPQIFQNIFEEFGFRGYLAPGLYSLGMNVFAAHVLVGLIWGLWHLPYLAAITPYTAESTATLFPRFLAGAVAASIVYGEIRILTGSVWPAVFMQTAGGAVLGALLLQNLLAVDSGVEFLFLPVIESLSSIVLFTAVGIGIYMLRTKRTKST